MKVFQENKNNKQMMLKIDKLEVKKSEETVQKKPI